MDSNNQTVQEREQRLVNAFKVLDTLNTGFIAEKLLKHYLTTFGNKIGEKEVDEMYREYDAKCYTEYLKNNFKSESIDEMLNDYHREQMEKNEAIEYKNFVENRLPETIGLFDKYTIEKDGKIKYSDFAKYAVSK